MFHRLLIVLVLVLALLPIQLARALPAASVSISSVKTHGYNAASPCQKRVLVAPSGDGASSARGVLIASISLNTLSKQQMWQSLFLKRVSYLFNKSYTQI
jgi:hypothetical protein